MGCNPTPYDPYRAFTRVGRDTGHVWDDRLKKWCVPYPDPRRKKRSFWARHPRLKKWPTTGWAVGCVYSEDDPMIRELHPEQAAELRRAFAAVIERNAPEMKPDQVENLAGVLVGLASLDVPEMIEQLKVNHHARGKTPEQDQG
jgi:hypothetical protein